MIRLLTWLLAILSFIFDNAEEKGGRKGDREDKQTYNQPKTWKQTKLRVTVLCCVSDTENKINKTKTPFLA